MFELRRFLSVLQLSLEFFWLSNSAVLKDILLEVPSPVAHLLEQFLFIHLTPKGSQIAREGAVSKPSFV